MPLSYWLQRYTYAGAGPLIHRSLLIEVVFLVGSLSAGVSISISFFVSLLLAKFIFYAFHEFGYFVNDHIVDGVSLQNFSKFKSLGSRRCFLFSALFSRILWICALGAVLFHLVGSYVFLFFVCVVGFVQVAFFAHNHIKFPVKLGSFFCINVGNYGCLLPLLHGAGNAVTTSYLLLCFAMAAAFTVKYACDRAVTFRTSGIGGFLGALFAVGTGHFKIRLALFWICLLSPLGFWFSEVDASMLLGVICWLCGVDVVLYVARLAAGIRSALGNRFDILHVHTYFSHDASNSIEDIYKACLESGRKRVYVTDHAEDFDFTSYSWLKAECEAISDSSVQVIAGLEYAVFGQHFLALNLDHYIDIDGKSVGSIDELRAISDVVIWAHPFFGIKKLLKLSYLKSYYQMILNTDRVEILNFKVKRGIAYYAWRHCLIGALCMGSGACRFTVGVDAHDSVQLQEITPKYPLDLLRSRLSKRPGKHS